jgi:hypothetical protein
MNKKKPNNLVRNLKKEFARNKAKTAVLAIGCVVMVYYWIPLLTGGKKSPKADASVQQDDSPQPAVETTTHVSTTTTPPTEVRHWTKIAEAIKSDPYMTSAPPAESTESPFAGFQPTEEEPEANSEANIAEIVGASTSPKDLVVNGVMVGGTRSVATINGFVYRLGDYVSSRNVDTAGQYQIVSIQPDFVAVVRNGQRHRLAINKPWSSSQGNNPSSR